MVRVCAQCFPISFPRTIKAQKDLDYKALTNIFSLLFENSMVLNYFPWFAIYLCINLISSKIIKLPISEKTLNKNCHSGPV